mgnify:CR=1 FL=1
MLDIKSLEGKRIAVLLSGGVDSSVVVWEFARLGLHPDCFYIKIGPGRLSSGILERGDSLHHGEGEGWLYAQS